MLPNAFPLTVQPSNDPCSAQLTQGKNFAALTVSFFDRYLKHKPVKLPALNRFYLATAGGTCTTTTAVTPNKTVDAGTVASPELAGPAIATKIADGPIRVAGTPYLSGDVTALGDDNDPRRLWSAVLAAVAGCPSVPSSGPLHAGTPAGPRPTRISSPSSPPRCRIWRSRSD